MSRQARPKIREQRALSILRRRRSLLRPRRRRIHSQLSRREQRRRYRRGPSHQRRCHSRCDQHPRWRRRLRTRSLLLLPFHLPRARDGHAHGHRGQVGAANFLFRHILGRVRSAHSFPSRLGPQPRVTRTGTLGAHAGHNHGVGNRRCLFRGCTRKYSIVRGQRHLNPRWRRASAA